MRYISRAPGEAMNIKALGRYVDRVMAQKGLSARDIERKTGKKVDNSYVVKIIKGKIPNPSIKAILSLAEGLEVNPHEILTVISGQPPQGERRDTPDAMAIVDVMQKLVMNPELIEVAQAWMGLFPEDKERMMESLIFLNEQNEERRYSKPRKKRKR
jgi:transcriptional regulator with XRE-family HTH domain